MSTECHLSFISLGGSASSLAHIRLDSEEAGSVAAGK